MDESVTELDCLNSTIVHPDEEEVEQIGDIHKGGERDSRRRNYSLIQSEILLMQSEAPNSASVSRDITKPEKRDTTN